MKFFIYIFLCLFSFTTAFSQNGALTKKEMRKLEKIKEKEEKARQTGNKVQLINTLIEEQKFVLEADRLQNNRGQLVYVNSTINFIAIDSLQATIQIANGVGNGANGLGGVTAEGRIKSFKVNQNENKGTTNVHLSIISSIAFFDVFISVSKNGYVSARLYSGTGRGNLTFIGDIVPLKESQVYKGFSY